jgi:hypothetical protein
MAVMKKHFNNKPTLSPNPSSQNVKLNFNQSTMYRPILLMSVDLQALMRCHICLHHKLQAHQAIGRDCLYREIGPEFKKTLKKT